VPGDAPFHVVMLAGGCTLLGQKAARELLPHCTRHGVPIAAAAILVLLRQAPVAGVVVGH
jgi:hypothetical protein